jgi:hypothetical protein
MKSPVIFQESISISRAEFERSVKELNPYVNPAGLHAITYEYTWYIKLSPV